MKKLLALALMLCVPWPLSAQNAITQEGTVLQNSPMMFKGNNRSRQGATVDGAPFGQSVTTGDSVIGGRCDYSGPTDDPLGYYRLCINGAKGQIILDGTRTPLHQLKFVINGVEYSFPEGAVGPPGPGAGMNSSAPCDGLTDVTAAMQAEVNDYSNAGGGIYHIPVGKGCVVGTSTHLEIPYNVQLSCSMTGGGYWPSHNYQNYADFLVDPSHTIRTVTPTAVLGGRSGMWGCLVVKKGFVGGTDLRAAINSINAFSGTAFVCTGSGGGAGQVDVELRNNMFIGFQTAVVTSCDRFHFVGNRGDATNFLSVLSCNDICEVHDDHVWPFASSPYAGSMGGGGQAQNTTVTSAVITGGNVLTLGFAAPPVPFVTGDTVVLAKIGGITGAQWGRFTATVVDPTHISVQSAFSGAFTSDGTIRISSMRRAGTAFNFAAGGGGGPLARHLTNFGHDVGIHYAGGSVMHCDGCWMDNDTSAANADPLPVAMLLDGVSGLTNYYQGYLNAPGLAILKNDDSILTVGPGTQMASLNNLVGTHVIRVNKGVLQLSSLSVFTDMGQGTGDALYIGSAATAIEIYGGPLTGSVTFEGGNADCPKLRANGSVGPCTYTPTYTGAAIAGTPLQAIWWNNGGRTTVYYLDSGKTVSSQTATQFSVSMPTIATFGGSCSIGALSAAMTAGHTQHLVNIPATTNQARFSQVASATGSNDILAGTALGSPNLLSMICTYQ